MDVYTGRPKDKREDREERTYQLLDELCIPFTRVDHEEIMTMEGILDVNKALDVEVCKNLLLCNSQKTKFYLLMLPGDKKFKTKVLSKQINSARLSFAKPEPMLEYLDILPGSLSVLGLMNDIDNHVQLLIDKDIYDSDYIGCHPCKNTSTLKIKKEDLINKILPHVHHDYIIVNLET